MEFIALVLVVIIWISFSRHSTQQKELQERLTRLEFRIDSLQNQQTFSTNINQQQDKDDLDTDSRSTTDESPQQRKQALEKETIEASELAASKLIEKPDSIAATIQAASNQVTTNNQATISQAISREPSRLFTSMKENWMLWLGGLCVALSGIFLAKYSIEQGLLSPTARITLGAIVGLTLLGVSEWFRRKKGAHPSFAALAGGGSITLYAMILAALHFYQMISPTTAFILLAIIALATMALSYLHGPALAAIGLLGAYCVPIFISDGSGAIHIALGYALIITASAILLMRYVYRDWLWRGILIGALAWWLISLGYSNITLLQGWYLAAIAYFLLAIPTANWTLQHPFLITSNEHEQAKPSTLLYSLMDKREWQLRLGLLLIIAAHALTFALSHNLSIAIYAFSPLLFVLLISARRRESMTLLPWILIISNIVAILASQASLQNNQLSIQALTNSESIDLARFIAVTSFISITLGVTNLLISRFKGTWSSFITLAPLLLLTLTFYLSTELLTKWQWASLFIILAGSYLLLARLFAQKTLSKAIIVWLVFAGHFAASLTAIVLTQNGQLTLAIALQLVSLAWIIKTFDLAELSWLLKLIAAIVVTRLTLNPWLADYDISTHWSLIGYGGSTACCIAATLLLRPYPTISKWAEAAALHLFVLFCWAELRYWLNNGNIFQEQSSLLEVSLTMTLFAALSLVYYLRSKISESLEKIYFLFSFILITLAILCYASIILATLIQNPFVWKDVGLAPIWNIMLLSFGLPIALGWLTWRFHHPDLSKSAAIFTGLASFIFINLQIKHLWNQNIKLYDTMPSGELYTYSIVWLLCAIVAILGGALKSSRSIYKAGLALLGLVIAKLFIVDMSDLDGLLRIASFMGLGISLLGLYYLHQRIQNSLKETEA